MLSLCGSHWDTPDTLHKTASARRTTDGHAHSCRSGGDLRPWGERSLEADGRAEGKLEGRSHAGCGCRIERGVVGRQCARPETRVGMFCVSVTGRCHGRCVRVCGAHGGVRAEDLFLPTTACSCRALDNSVMTPDGPLTTDHDMETRASCRGNRSVER